MKIKATIYKAQLTVPKTCEDIVSAMIFLFFLFFVKKFVARVWPHMRFNTQLRTLNNNPGSNFFKKCCKTK